MGLESCLGQSRQFRAQGRPAQQLRRTKKKFHSSRSGVIGLAMIIMRVFRTGSEGPTESKNGGLRRARVDPSVDPRETLDQKPRKGIRLGPTWTPNHGRDQCQRDHGYEQYAANANTRPSVADDVHGASNQFGTGTIKQMAQTYGVFAFSQSPSGWIPNSQTNLLFPTKGGPAASRLPISPAISSKGKEAANRD